MTRQEQELQEANDTLRVMCKYLAFDLWATRREKKQLQEDNAVLTEQIIDLAEGYFEDSP